MNVDLSHEDLQVLMRALNKHAEDLQDKAELMLETPTGHTAPQRIAAIVSYAKEREEVDKVASKIGVALRQPQCPPSPPARAL